MLKQSIFLKNKKNQKIEIYKVKLNSDSNNNNNDNRKTEIINK